MKTDILSVQLKVQELQILCEGADFDWDKKNPWVKRGEGGKFSKSSSSEPTAEAETGKSPNAVQKAINKIMGKAEDISSSLDKLPDSSKDKISQAINSSGMKKARVATRAKFDAMGKEAGEAFSEANTQISAIFETSGGNFKKAFNKSKRVVKAMIDTAKDQPALVAVGALGALMATIGTGGAIAFFTVPNLFGLGGVYGGIAAITAEQSVQSIVSAFAAGGLSQISFGVSLDLIAGGLTTMALDAAIFAEQTKEKLAITKK